VGGGTRGGRRYNREVGGNTKVPALLEYSGAAVLLVMAPVMPLAGSQVISLTILMARPHR
jgi:hypothetical protein